MPYLLLNLSKPEGQSLRVALHTALNRNDKSPACLDTPYRFQLQEVLAKIETVVKD